MMRRHAFELTLLLVLIALAAAYWGRTHRPEPPDNYHRAVRQIEQEWRQGQVEACRATCLALLSKEPGELRGLRYLALVHLRQGQRDKALEILNRGLANHSQDPWGLSEALYGQRLGGLYLERGRIHLTRWRWDEAQEDAEKALDLLSYLSDDYILAEDLMACALSAEGKRDLALDYFPEERPHSPEGQALLEAHRAQLDGKQSPAGPVLWHAQPCPLCP